MRGAILIYLAVIPLICGGCDDMFTSESSSTFSSDAVFNNEALATEAVNGLYAAMCDDDLYSKKLPMYFSMNTDIEYISGNTDNGRRAIARYCATPANTELYGTWSAIYAAIEKANNCIYGLQHSHRNGKERTKELYAQALCLRALLYFDLVKNWGDVPFHTLPTSINHDNITLVPQSRYIILNQLLSDLDEAQQELKWANEYGTSERVSKGFAKGLRAKIALYCAGFSSTAADGTQQRPENYREYYKIAEKECRDIISSAVHHLNPSFEDFFKKQCAYIKDISYYESLFELALGRQNKGELGNYIGVKHEENNLYGKSEAGMYATPSFFYSYAPQDKRRMTTCALHKYNTNAKQELTNITTITIAKWRKEWITPPLTGSSKYTGINFCFMRYSDVLLMFAEANNELNNGPTTEAQNALKEVRKRAFTDSLHAYWVEHYVDTATSKSSFLSLIERERAWEFAGEAIRKYDLARWGKLYSKLTECKQILKQMQNHKPPFDTLPQKIYWRLKDDNETIEIANTNSNYIPNEFKLSDSQNKKWTSNISTAFIDKVFEGTECTTFLPYPQQATTDSEGKLSNVKKNGN